MGKERLFQSDLWGPKLYGIAAEYSLAWEIHHVLSAFYKQGLAKTDETYSLHFVIIWRDAVLSLFTGNTC